MYGNFCLNQIYAFKLFRLNTKGILEVFVFLHNT